MILYLAKSKLSASPSVRIFCAAPQPNAQRLRKCSPNFSPAQRFKLLAQTLQCSSPHQPLMNAFATAPVSTPSSSRQLRRLVLVAGCLLSSALFAQPDPIAPATGEAQGRQRRGQNGEGGRANLNPEEMQQRITARLREQYEVTDDEEWKLISERINAVTELRRSTMAAALGGRGGGLAGFGGAGGGGGQNRGGGRGVTNNPEQDALRQAVTDKLPDAEVKSRLDRLRESRKANEEKLAKAQEELRAVLSVRQEAVAVMSGLLP